MNSRLIGTLHCLFRISSWMTNRNFNLYKSKIKYLVSPTPRKHTASSLLNQYRVFPSQSMTIAPIELLDQKKKKKKERKSQNHTSYHLFPYIRESYGLYFQSIFRIEPFLTTSCATLLAQVTVMSHWDKYNSLPTGLTSFIQEPP